MKTITVVANAKINLSLDVIGRRADGYHLLSTIMQSVCLADRITVSSAPDRVGVRLTCGQARIPSDSRNTAWRSAARFLEKAGVATGVSIDIDKRIPTAAGMAGGSADAAAVLFALNEMYPERLSRQTLFEIAATIGADVPFCLQGGTVLCEGIGELLTPMQLWADVWVLLCKPSFGIRTPWVFSQFKIDQPGRRPDQAKVMDAVRNHDLEALAASTSNVLESVSIPAHPFLNEIKQQLKNAGAILSLMSGSGPTVFGLFADQASCLAAKNKLTAELPADTIIIATQTCASGCLLAP